MALTVTMTGSGTHGAILPGWSITEECTPAVPGDSRGSVGSASYAARATETSRFVMDNNVKLSDSSAGSFSGRVSDVSLGAASIAVSVAGPFQFLNVDKVLPPIGLDQTVDLTLTTYGSGTGQFGRVQGVAVDPVDGGYLISSQDTVDGVDRYKIIKYNSSGAYVTEFGASGSSNGQIGIFGATIAVSPVDQAVWIGDYANRRIQKFTTADGGLTYSFSLASGSSGTGNGQFNSNNPYISVAVDSSGNVYASDRGNARVQKFNSSGTYQSQVAVGTSTLTAYAVSMDASDLLHVGIRSVDGTVQTTGQILIYNTSLVLQQTITLTSLSEGSVGIGLFSCDPGGGVWISSVRDTGVTFYDSSWQPTLTVYGANAASVSAGDDATLLYQTPGVYTTDRKVVAFRFEPVALSASVERYMAECDPALNGWAIDWQAATDPDVVLPGWSGNVWSKLKELFATYGIELGYDADAQSFIVYDIGSRQLSLPNMEPTTTKPENLTGGRVVDVIYQQPRAGGGIVWDAATENVRIQIGVGESQTIRLYTNNHPTSVSRPQPTGSSPTEGRYNVVDSTGALVTAEAWDASGAGVTVEVGDSPGTVIANVRGPLTAISGYTAPFTFATGTGAGTKPAFSIVGNGVFCNPQTFIRAESQGQPYDSPFMDTIDRACSRGHAPSLQDPNVTLTMTVPTRDLPGIGQTAGCIVPFEQSRYRITRVVWGNLKSQLTLERHVTAEDWEDTWAGETAADYEAYWPDQGYSAGDEQVQPLRHA